MKAQRAGAEYRFNNRVSGVKIEPDQVIVTLFNRDKTEQISARCVVAACGYVPGFIGRLGLGTFRDFTYGAQAEVTTVSLDEVEVYFGDMAPDFFAWLVPISSLEARAGLLSRGKPGDYLKIWLELLKSRGIIASADVKITSGAIPLKPPNRTYGERLIAVGDAAGQVKPTSGGGIYYGLLCADIAADTLHQALAEDNLSVKRLALYEKAWHAKLGRELKKGYRARKFFEGLSYNQINGLFKIAKSGGIEKAISKARGVSFDWHSRTMKQIIKYRFGLKS